jgi:hypothetical protein
MFSLDTAIDLMFKIEIKVPLKDNTSEMFIALLFINQKMTVYTSRDYLQKFINEMYANIVQEYENKEKKDIAKKLRKEFSTRPPLKFTLQKEPGGSYVAVFNSPVEIRSTKNWLCELFELECEKTSSIYIFNANTNYVSKNIQTLPLIEWHCNIPEYSYTNHNDHPHLHKQEELLHISLINNNFYENPVYKESPKKIMFISLRRGLREIREIILTPLNENGEEIKNLQNVIAYLQLKEE